MIILLWIITIILIIFFIDKFGYEFIGCSLLLMCYIGILLLIISSLVLVYQYFNNKTEDNQLIENQIKIQGQEYQKRTKELEYLQKVKEFSPDVYRCLEEAKKEFYKNNYQEIAPTILILEDSLYYQNCINK